MDKQILTTGMLLLVILLGCGSNRADSKTNPDKFYTVTGGWDWIRVPLPGPWDQIR